MLNLRKQTIDYVIGTLGHAYERTYGDLEPAYPNIIRWVGRLALENIANSDALYHNLEHTVLVTAVGQSIMEGKHLCEGGVTPREWLHYTVALLCHDIGYVRGVCRSDAGLTIVTGVDDATVTLAAGATDAALTPYHVDRSKLFVVERFGGEQIAEALDAALIGGCIELTRYPAPDTPAYRDTSGFPGLTRAADFIGQLGDPDYLRKAPALFHEFAEIGANARYGYTSPDDLRAMFPTFYWQAVSPFIQDALRYLRQTHEGKAWIASLNSLLYASEKRSE